MAYYGLDWIAGILTIWAIHALGKRERNGFLLMIAGNICWVALGILSQIWGMIVLNLLFVGMNVRGYRQWREPAAT